MNSLFFLASAEAMKPSILMDSFYTCSNRDARQDYLLTNANDGATVDYCMSKGMTVIVNEDEKFNSFETVRKLPNVSGGVLVSCGWPHKIPVELIDIFSAAVNCHGSYLPDYRGSRAYMHYWANCSEYYGATIHYLTEEFDDGNIIIRAKLKQLGAESNDDMFIRTAELCGILLQSALQKVENGDPGFRDDSIPIRYFYKRTPEEFIEYRSRNEKLLCEGKALILTPHRILRE